MDDKCPDCQTDTGQRHIRGCDVARCSQHGRQALQCEGCWNLPWTHWTGEWPGVEECREFDMYVWDFPGIPGKSEDLNQLAWMGMTGQLVWSPEKERWTRPDKSAKLGA